jgi:DnaJ-like protein
MPATLVPEDDLYARLEVGIDASPEAIELAWRALLKRHHPDVAGDDAIALERAKRINVAHDWLADPSLRARYDRERLGLSGLPVGVRDRTGVRYGRSPRARAWPPGPAGQGPGAARPARARHRSIRSELGRGDPAERFGRFLDRVSRLTPDELDRLCAAEPPPIAFLATIRRFLTPEAAAAFEAAETELAARVPHERWTRVGLREGLLGVAAELVLSGFLDETLAEPFRGRARDRLLRAWEASVDQPRFGPNGAQVEATRLRAGALGPAQVAAFVRASTGIPGDDRPWPVALDRDEDEALRISATLAAQDVAAALPADGLAPATATRARRLLGRLGHVVALRHAFPSSTYAALVAPFATATGTTPDDGRARAAPGVRRSR